MNFDREQIIAWLERKDANALAAYLVSGTHHGKPGAPQAIKVKVIALIHAHSTRRELLTWAKALMRRREATAREVACGLVAAEWEHDPDATLQRMRTLAEDEDWGVREWAVGPMAEVLGQDFARVLGIYRTWVKDGSEALRRAIALALGAQSRARIEAQAKPMLDLIALLMPLPGAYLQKNLGPFVVGGAFLSRFPQRTLTFLRQQSRKKDENVRWNVAMAFTAAAARKHGEAGAEILEQLAGDDRPRVAAAVAKARRNLARGPGR